MNIRKRPGAFLLGFFLATLAATSPIFSAAEAASTYYQVTPSVSALAAYGKASGVSILNASVTGVGNYNWAATCPTTADGSTLVAATGVATGCWVLQASGGASFNAVGTIYENGNFTSLAGFAPNGTTPAVSGGTLVFPPGAANFARSLDLTARFTTLDKWRVEAHGTVAAPGPITIGLGIGARGYSASTANFACVPYLTNDANAGKIFLQDGGSITVGSSAAISFSTGDSVGWTCERNGTHLTATFWNITTASAPVTVSYDSPLSYPTPGILPNRSRFAIFAFGTAAQTLTYFKVSSEAPVGVDVVLVGDSKTVPYYPGTPQSGWPALLAGPLIVANESGGGDQTADVVAVLPEIIGRRPRAVVLNIGRNDLGAGVPPSTWQANYATITSTLSAAGIRVFNLLPIPENTTGSGGAQGIDQSALTNYITATQPADSLILSGCERFTNPISTVVAPDGVHPTQLCNASIAGNVRAKVLSTVGSYRYDPPAASAPFFQTGNLVVGAVTQPPNIQNLFAFGSNSSRTDTTEYRVGNLAQTNDATGPFALSEYVTGSSLAVNRRIDLQTSTDGIASEGVLALQTTGGNLLLGNSGGQVVVLSTLNAGNATVIAPKSLIVNAGVSRSTVASTLAANLVQSNDVTTPFALGAYLNGNAAAASQQAMLQTILEGSGSSGNLSLQGTGGTTTIGGTTVPTAISGVKLLVLGSSQINGTVFLPSLSAASAGHKALCFNNVSFEVTVSSTGSCP